MSEWRWARAAQPLPPKRQVSSPGGRTAPLTKALGIARRTRDIALQSVFVGLGLSIVGMMAAAFGYLPPVQGALFQEAIDVAVIVNALRALR